MKVLYLTEWYPNRYDDMSGLFVRKHAEAAARCGANICVLYLHRDSHVHKVEIVCQRTNSIQEIYVYYSGCYLHALLTGYRTVQRTYGMPDICQLNILNKNGLLAEWLWRVHGKPYLLVEHWSGYLPQNYSFREGWHKRLMQRIARDARCILTVSQSLTNAMKACGITNNTWKNIHNVVDDFFYKPFTGYRPFNEKKRLLHVSCFDEKAKNIRGMLRAVRHVAEKRQDFEMVLVGTGTDWNKNKAYADSLHFPAGTVRFIGKQSPEEVSEWMHCSDAFVLFSNYETYGIVLAEAMAAGLPCISTNTTGMVIPDTCGITVPAGDEETLALMIDSMLDSYRFYEPSTLRKASKDYTANKIGSQLSRIYREMLRS